jgi:hypothetical protein
MDERIIVPKQTVEVLRQIRTNASQMLQKQTTQDEVNMRIASVEAEIKSLAQGFQSSESEAKRQERQNAINEVGSELEELDALKARLARELSAHRSSLVYFRERLEDELCRALEKSGQLDAEIDVSYLHSNQLTRSMESRDISQDIGEEYLTTHGKSSAENSYPADKDGDSEDCRIGKARTLLVSTKEDLQDATMSFLQLERLCEAQRHEFETRMIPELHGMSRTEFDLEQLAQKIELTKELIRAGKAYSEAGRYAAEVGFIREDSDQSCHFVEDPADGACSGNKYAAFVEEKDLAFIEAWRERIGPQYSTSPVSGEGDAWEVDSVQFGEGCSTHADEWYKTRIDRWEEVREKERVKMRTMGNIAFADEVFYEPSPALDLRGLPFPMLAATEESAQVKFSGAGGWIPSLEIMKELLVSGQAVLANFSVGWSSGRGSDRSMCS